MEGANLPNSVKGQPPAPIRRGLKRYFVQRGLQLVFKGSRPPRLEGD